MNRLRQIKKNNGIDEYVVPQEDAQLVELRKAVSNADWGNIFAQRQTRTLCSSAWSASESRCRNLRAICAASGAKRVLEIGSFVGVSALAMAQVLPDNGHITSLEIDPFLVDFGLDIKAECDAFWKISHMVGPAWLSLQSLIEQAQDSDGSWEPFDLAVIDADKAGMMEYFQILSEVPGLMRDDYVICVDVTPFKGQLSTHVHDKLNAWLINSGQTEIEALRELVTSSADFESCEDAGLLQVCKKVSFTMASPFASFPNCYSANASSIARWAAPKTADTVDELRKAVLNTDWAGLFAEGRTKALVSASWSATWERCEKLQDLCSSGCFRRALEIGAFCGVASLAMAEALPEDGEVVSLELDPFLVDFAQDIKAKSKASSKIDNMIGPAQASLESLAASGEQFDLVVIDADKASMLEYFKIVWDSTTLLSEGATVCVDIAPFKCQLFAPYVKGRLDDWIVKSGQEHIDAFLAFARSLPDADVIQSSSLVIIQKSD